MKLMKMKNCKNCIYNKYVYINFVCKYWKSEYFYCLHKNKLTKPENFCKNWGKNNKTYDLSLKRFDKIIEDIKFLKEHL